MVNVKQLKQSLTSKQIITILQNLGSDVYQQHDNEIIFYSCCHHVVCKDHKPKLYYYIDTHSFFCYSCSSAFDIYSLIETRWHLLNQDCVFADVVNYIINLLGLNYNKFTTDTIIKKTEFSWKTMLEKYDRFGEINPILEVWDRNILRLFDQQYPVEWINEGISVQAMQQFQICYYTLYNQTVIPCFDENNKLIGIRVRNWEPERIKKAKYDSLVTITNYREKNAKKGTDFRFNTSKVLYGLNLNKYAIEHRKIVILAESEKAVLKSTTWYGHNSITVAMFGSSLGEYRKRMLLNYKIDEIIIAPDYDYNDQESYEKWKKKQLKLGYLFKNFCTVSIIINLENIVSYKNNAFDVNQEQFEFLLNKRVNMFI